MMCVTTRFRLKHFWMLLPMYLTYRRLRRDLKRAPGLIRYAFLVQSPLACCTLSIWESEESIITFSNVPNHIRGVRGAGRWCREIWSAYWRIHAVSMHANRWEGPGRGHWPKLLPDPEFPWQLVPSPPLQAGGK